MSVLLIAGSPSERSRTGALLESVGQRLETRGALVNRLRVRELSPQALGARHIPAGIYATDAQVTLSPEGRYQVDTAIGARLDDAVHGIVTESLSTALTHAGRFAPVQFSQVRCSV